MFMWTIIEGFTATFTITRGVIHFSMSKYNQMFLYKQEMILINKRSHRTKYWMSIYPKHRKYVQHLNFPEKEWLCKKIISENYFEKKNGKIIEMYVLNTRRLC